MSMIVLVPSRGRPGNVERLQANLAETMTTDSRVLFLVDEDDPELREYQALDPIDIAYGKRLKLGGTLNFYANIHVRRYDIVGFMGDDVRPMTVGWDARIMEAMTRNGVVYGNDGVHGPALPTSVFLDARIVKVQGFMVPPGMTHLFIDNYWKELGERLKTLTYLPDVLLEHLHPLVGKGEQDQTYTEANTEQVWSMDQARLKAHIESGEMDEWVRRILA